MVTTLTLPSTALGFSLDANNQYLISVTLYMTEIFKLIKGISVNSYLKHHNLKFQYDIKINGTTWKSDTFKEMTNSNVVFTNENISGWLDSNKVKQALTCTVEVSHPQFYYKLFSENYTFIAINQKPGQLKGKNSSTGEYNLIGLQFSGLSEGAKSELNEIRWPVFNTENSSQQFVIPMSAASSTRKIGSVRAERFGGQAGQYFNLETNPGSSKDLVRANGTEYTNREDWSPTVRYYYSYDYKRTHSTSVNSDYWASPSAVTAPTLNANRYDYGRYTTYSFGGWSRNYTFYVTSFYDARHYAPGAYYRAWRTLSNHRDVRAGYGIDVNDTYGFYCWGKDFTWSYRDYAYYTNSYTWPDTPVVVSGGSVYVSGEREVHATTPTRGSWEYMQGYVESGYCYGGPRRAQSYESTSYVNYNLSYGRPQHATVMGILSRWNRDHPDKTFDDITTARESTGYVNSGPSELVRVEIPGAGYTSAYGDYMPAYQDVLSPSTYTYYTIMLGCRYYFALTEYYEGSNVSSINYKYGSVTGYLSGNEFEYRNWIPYETRTLWYIDSNYNQLGYYSSTQEQITNDRTTYKTS